ncbi:uncharacterized protein EDB91DRAFT_1084478 [Suillus paluster]|uniref:uncharacterized protein n=1 Tax=Suillus paluster TaxID=48578 RepID=UPI001B86CEF1|nr:uncharacterized protein EDB91DRAFT_1084478 [Suillus paluster]KAG1733199.1 hypothetical protein EDB91DRAFT_1084478 [Suillus paluster]
MPSTDSLRPRTATGQVVTNSRLKTNWAVWSAETSAASSPLDTPERSSSSSLSSLEEDEEHNNVVPFPELEIPELDLQIPPIRLQSLQRYKKTEPLTSISTVPDYDLARFFALAQPKINMHAETPQIFHGDGCASENPVDFLKPFNRTMRQQTIATSSDKLDAFGDYLGTSSRAETWFKALPPADKATWTAFVIAFEKRWPLVTIAEKTKAEYERELLDHVLPSTERKRYSSPPTQTSIKLPDVVKDLLKDEEYKTWTEFAKAVTELKGSRLAEKQEQRTRQAQELKALRAEVARVQLQVPPQNPMANLQNQFSKMALSPTIPPHAPSANSTFTRVSATSNQQSQQPTYSLSASHSATAVHDNRRDEDQQSNN